MGRSFRAIQGSAAALGVLCLCITLLAGPSPAAALPIATGSQCSSSWVNNPGALNCFIQGEDETRTGAKHPHYVACAGGDIFCCKDDDHGNQDCVAQAAGRPTTRADWLKAILSAHRAMLMSVGRYGGKPGRIQGPPPNQADRRAP